MAENSLYEAIRRGEAWAVCFYLKCMAKDRGYLERAELTGAKGAPVKIKLVYDEYHVLLGSGPLLRREASSAGVGVPKKPGFWVTRRGPLDVFTQIPSL